MTITSKPYQPSPTLCCEGCAFGDTQHADFCPLRGLPKGTIITDKLGPGITYIPEGWRIAP